VCFFLPFGHEPGFSTSFCFLSFFSFYFSCHRYILCWISVQQWERHQAADLAMWNWMKSQGACVQPVTATLPNKTWSMVGRMLTYADVCWRTLTYADVCWRVLTYTDVGDSPNAARALMCSRIHADFSSRMLCMCHYLQKLPAWSSLLRDRGG
jgi:hypothetical protein